MSPDEPLWSVEQVCTYLNVGKTTVYEMMKNESLPVLKFGRVTRFSPAAVVAWVAAR